MMYRNDIAQGGATHESLSSQLHLKWTYQPAHRPEPAWSPPAEEMDRVHFDNAHHVTSADGLVYFGSSVDNKVYALDAETGTVRWEFYTEGPVRYAPAIWNNRVYAGSDDGNVYCLQAKDGKQVWKYRAGPQKDRVIGNGRMISLWPIRTSVLVDDGIVYFGAGVFPYEGVYICALSAQDGSIVWRNDTIGDDEHELAFGGITPQSYLVASDRILYVPSGRALPAAFDRNTGEFLYYMEPGGPWPDPKQGGVWTLLADNELITGVDRLGRPAKVAYDSDTGKRLGDAYVCFPGIDMVVDGRMTYIATVEGLVALDREKYRLAEGRISKLIESRSDINSRLSDIRRKARQAEGETLVQLKTDQNNILENLDRLTTEQEELKASIWEWRYTGIPLSRLIVANNSVVAGGEGVVLILDAQSGEELWKSEVSGKVLGLSSTAGKLFVSTENGHIHCFDSGEITEPAQDKTLSGQNPFESYPKKSFFVSNAEDIIRHSGITKGYGLVLGSSTGSLAYELAERTDLQIIGIGTDHERLAEARNNLDTSRLYGSRIVVEPWELASLPDYFANLIVIEDVHRSGSLEEPFEELFRVLRPYGGTMLLGWSADDTEETNPEFLERWLDSLPPYEDLKTDVIRDNGFWIRIKRGGLAGAGEWTQQYGNPQNTACSGDELVNGSLGVLWFGEPGPQRVLERHARGTSPVAMNGRLFQQGGELISCYDAYNGTMLWERRIPGAVRPYADIDTGNLALAEDGLYVAAHDLCYRLDPATGSTIRTYRLPRSTGNSRRWAYISIKDGILYGSAAPSMEEYAAVWKYLVENGEWKPIDEVPSKYKEAYKVFKKDYPVPDHELLKEFKRSGNLYRTMTDWPRGDLHAIKGALSGGMLTSDEIFAFDPNTGRRLWSYKGERIAQITVVVEDDKIFFAENAVSKTQKQRSRKFRLDMIKAGIYESGSENEAADNDLDIRLAVCLNARTGRVIWRKAVDFTGCCGDRMGAIYKNGVLLFSGNLGNHDAWRFKAGHLVYRRIVALSGQNGDMLWSRPLNYRTRPLIVGDQVIIEPRACDLRTGQTVMRSHPITGQKVPWEFLRPGHTCAVTAASADTLFYRSHSAAFHDLTEDRGVTLFGAVRPGCLINMIPASGVLLFPEASSGCTCSFPIRTSVVMVKKKKRSRPWTVFITHGTMTPARHFAVNFGAPGDMKDDGGMVWFGYPNPVTRSWHNHFPDYGVKFDLEEDVAPGMGYFSWDFRGDTIEDTDRPWLFTSGCFGLQRCEVPLIDDVWREEAGLYTVRLGFCAPESDRPGQRVFDIALQGRRHLENFDIVKEAGGPKTAVIKEFKGIRVENSLQVELTAEKSRPTLAESTLINFIEIIREDPEDDVEPSPILASMGPKAVDSLLTEAESERVGGNVDKALGLFHEALDGASTLIQKKKALAGMAAIGSPQSLSRIEPYCRDLDSIIWEYKQPNREIINDASLVFISIADRLAETNSGKARKMLTNALDFVNLEIRPQVVASLEKEGVPVGEEAASQGFLTRFHLLGPFPGYPLDLSFIPETEVDLDGSYEAEGRVLRWREFVSPDWKVDLAGQMDPHAYVTAYVFSEFDMPEEREILLKIGCNNGFRLMLNGNEVGSIDYEDTKWNVDQDVFPVEARKGTNRILLRIYQHRDEWEFAIRVTDTNGRPVLRSQLD